MFQNPAFQNMANNLMSNPEFKTRMDDMMKNETLMQEYAKIGEKVMGMMGPGGMPGGMPGMGAGAAGLGCPCRHLECVASARQCSACLAPAARHLHYACVAPYRDALVTDGE